MAKNASTININKPRIGIVKLNVQTLPHMVHNVYLCAQIVVN